MLRNQYEFVVLIIFDLLTKVLRNHHESIVLIIFDLLTKVLRNHHEFTVLIILDLLTKLLRKHHDPSHAFRRKMNFLKIVEALLQLIGCSPVAGQTW